MYKHMHTHTHIRTLCTYLKLQPCASWPPVLLQVMVTQGMCTSHENLKKPAAQHFHILTATPGALPVQLALKAGLHPIQSRLRGPLSFLIMHCPIQAMQREVLLLDFPSLQCNAPAHLMIALAPPLTHLLCWTAACTARSSPTSPCGEQSRFTAPSFSSNVRGRW